MRIFFIEKNGKSNYYKIIDDKKIFLYHKTIGDIPLKADHRIGRHLIRQFP